MRIGPGERRDKMITDATFNLNGTYLLQSVVIGNGMRAVGRVDVDLQLLL